MDRKPRTLWITVLLNCHHTVDFERRHAPMSGESVYCRTCGDYMTVQGITHQITARCNKCRYSRSFGQDKIAAMRAAGRHVTGHASHKVMVKNGTQLLKVVTIGTAQLAMGDLIRQSSVDGQAALRGFQDRLSRQRQDPDQGIVT